MLYKKKIIYIGSFMFLTAIVFLYVNIYVIFPSVSDLVVKNTQKEAVIVAKMLSSMIVKDGKYLNSDPTVIEKTIVKHENDFKFEKIKVFSTDGKIVFSTDQKDIGTINKHDYFFTIVAKGDIYTKAVKKDTESLEGRKVKTDVIETYVPIMDGDKFLGAYEIYYDVTDRNIAMNNIATRYSILALFLVFAIMIFSIVFLVKEDKSTIVHKPGFLSKIYHSPIILMLTMMAFLFTIEMIIMLVMDQLPELFNEIGPALDGLLLVMLMTPFLYFLLVVPITHNIKERELAEKSLENASKILEENLQAATASLSNRILELEKQIESQEDK